MKRKTIAHYEIERRLGAGGSGVVYAANDLLLQRPVVLKMLHTGLLTAEQMRSTVLREARLASAIEHPNVCGIYEIGDSGGLVKILDFGLARRLTPEDARFDPAKPAPAKDKSVATTYTARGGTIRYMAPEPFVTGHSSVQSDVWALGVILYELAGGLHPFARADAEDFDAIR